MEERLLAVIATTAVLAGGLTFILGRWANQRRYFAAPIRERDQHNCPTPRVGGIAIVGSFLLVLIGVLFLAPSWLIFSPEKFWGLDKNIFGLVLATLILTAINIRDDFKALNWPIKLAFQFLAAVVIGAFGISIGWFTNPFGEQIKLGAFDIVFVIFWLIVISNTVNWIDGIDGLAGGVGVIALTVLLFLSLSPAVNQPNTALLAAIGLGAIAGFLPFNFLKPKAFLGDTGAIFIGFLIGVIAIISGGKIATTFLVLAIPFLDAITVFFWRLFNRQSPFSADRRHLHHRLLDMGMKPWQINVFFWGFSLFFGLIALNTQTAGKYLTILLAMAIMIILVTIYTLAPKISLGGKIWLKK